MDRKKTLNSIEQIFLVFIWLLGTFLITSVSLIIGKRYGIIYPTTILGALVIIANILATKIVSQLIDTTVFVTIAFAGIFPIIPLIISVYITKAVIAIIDTPFMYLIVKFTKNISLR